MTEKKTTTRKTTKAEAPLLEEEKKSPFAVFIDHQREAINNAGKAFESLLPEGVREHGGKAVEEMLEGYRGLFNDVLDNVIKTVDSTNKDLVDRLEKAKIEEENGKNV